MARLELDKDDLFESEFGEDMLITIDKLGNYLRRGIKGSSVQELLCEWFVYKAALKFMYGIDYAFTRESRPKDIIYQGGKSFIKEHEVFGIVNERDENDWLYRVEV